MQIIYKRALKRVNVALDATSLPGGVKGARVEGMGQSEASAFADVLSVVNYTVDMRHRGNSAM